MTMFFSTTPFSLTNVLCYVQRVQTLKYISCLFLFFLFKSNKFEVAGKERLKAIKVKFTFWYLKKWVKYIFVAGGGVPNILHQVSVPVITNDLCQDMFKKSGHRKIIRFANRLIHFIHSILDSRRYHWNFYLISSPCFSILQLIIFIWNF